MWVRSGRDAINIISRHCEFNWDVRTVPGDTPQQFADRLRRYCEPIIETMRSVSPNCNIVTEMYSDAPAMKAESGGAAEHLCKHLTGEEHTGVVSYGTEGGQFQELQFSTVVCGPGSIDQAHRPNEYIEIAQVEAAERFMLSLIAHLA